MEPLAFTSISWTDAGGHTLVLAAGNRDLSAPDAAALVGSVVRIDQVRYVVYGLSPIDKPVRAGQPFMMRVAKPS